MSRIVDKELICPCCACHIHAKTYVSVNVSTDPALKRRVLDKTINLIDCPHCKKPVMVATNLLYHDVNQWFMVWLRLNEYQEGGTEKMPELALLRHALKPYKLRLTNGWDDFVERIRILDSRLDEGLIEAIKAVIWPQLEGNAHRPYNGRFLYFIWADDFSAPSPKLYFNFALAASQNIVAYPKSGYDELAGTSASMNPPDGEWVHLDYNYMIGNSQ